MTTVGEIQALITANNKQFKDSVKETQSIASNVSNNINKTFTNTSKVIAETTKKNSQSMSLSLGSITKGLAAIGAFRVGEKLFEDAIKNSVLLKSKVEALKKPITDIFGKSLEIIIKIPAVDMLFKSVVTGLNNVSNFLSDLQNKGLLEAAKKSPGITAGLGVAGTAAIFAASGFIGNWLAKLFERIGKLFTPTLGGTVISNIDNVMAKLNLQGFFINLSELIKDIMKLDFRSAYYSIKIMLNTGVLIRTFWDSIYLIQDIIITTLRKLVTPWSIFITVSLFIANMINDYYNEFAKLDDGEEARGLIKGIFDGIKQVFTWAGDFFSWVATLDWIATVGEILKPIGDFFISLKNGITFIANSVMDAAKIINDKMAEGWFKLLFGDAFNDLEESTKSASLTEENRQRRLARQTRLQEESKELAEQFKNLQIALDKFVREDEIQKTFDRLKLENAQDPNEILRMMTEDFINTPLFDPTQVFADLADSMANATKEELAMFGFHVNEPSTRSEKLAPAALKGTIEANSILNSQEDLNKKNNMNIKSMLELWQDIQRNGIKLDNVQIANW